MRLKASQNWVIEYLMKFEKKINGNFRSLGKGGFA